MKISFGNVKIIRKKWIRKKKKYRSYEGNNRINENERCDSQGEKNADPIV